MNKLNIWETKFNESALYFNDIDEFINYLEKTNQYNYIVCDTHMPGEPIKAYLDRASNNQNIPITYTDKTHQVTIIKFDFWKTDIIINSQFYQKYQDKLIQYTKKKVLECIDQKKSTIYIPTNILTDDLIDLITSNEQLVKSNIIIYTVTNQTLTENQIKKIKDAHLNLFFDNEKISDNKLIENYTLIDLKNLKKLNIKDTIPLNEIDNFIYLNQNCQIAILPEFEEARDEPKYLNNLKKIIEILSKHNKTYNIQIQINNRELLKQSCILNTKNINFTIDNDLYNYTKEEYLQEEEKLEKLIEPIKKANLSPYEKYLAVYNIVKQFKPYKESPNNKTESRTLRYILNNEYMVCVGYSKLLKTLLDKVGIPCIEISVEVDVSYDNGFKQEETVTETKGHARNIIKIDDDKYNIHGIYIADATWDNDMDLDLYNNSSITFDKKKEAKRLETLTNKDLLLDFHNFDEFTQKINFLLKRETQKYLQSPKDYQKHLFLTYDDIYTQIMDILATLDYHKYQELYQKYNKLIKDNINNNKILENIYSNFLTDYAMYILPLTNKKIDNNILLEAIINTKKELHKYKQEEIENVKKKISSNYYKHDKLKFPYHYDTFNPISEYLETKEETRKKR